MNIDYYRITLETSGGTQRAMITSTAGVSPLIGAKWSLAKNGGCLDFKMQLKRGGYQQFGAIKPGELVKVYVKPSGGTEQIWYTGQLTDTPKAGTLSDIVMFKARGLWGQLEKTIILEYWATASISSIIGSIISNYYSGTDIRNSTSEVSLASAYTPADVECEYKTAADLIRRLAEVQGDVQYGVDWDRYLYFKDLDTTVDYHYWIGKDIASFDLTQNLNDLYNFVMIQAKKLVGGAMFMLVDSDATSISSYGKRFKLIQSPEFRDLDDVWRYVEKYVADHKDPKACLVTTPLVTPARMFPRAKVRITDLNATEYELPIEKVNYTIDGTKGLSQELELGDEPAADISEIFSSLDRSVALSGESMISSVRIEHSRDEEWTQDVQIDARKQGNHNIFVDAFADLNAIDRPNSFEFDYDSVRHFIRRGAADYPNSCTVYSKTIDIGREVDTIRVHANVNLYGKIDFTYAQDLPDYFTQPASGEWAIDKSEGAVYDTNNPAASMLEFSGDGLVYPKEYKFRVYATFGNGVNGGQVRWNYDPATGYYHYLKFTPYGSYGYTLELRVLGAGGDISLAGPINYAGMYDYLDIEVNDNSLAGYTLIKQPSGATLLSAGYWTVAGRAPSLYDFRDASSSGGRVLLKAIAITGQAACTISVSRDGGTTWTSAVTANGETNVNVDVSGQPTGTEIKLKATLVYPSQVLGWGWSCKNA